jgi:DNA ligase-1
VQSVIFQQLAEVFDELDKTSASSRMIRILADFFATLSPEDARLAAYLLKGQVAPDYVGTEFGVAKKLVIRALATAFHQPLMSVEKAFHKHGDLGSVAAQLGKDSSGAGPSIKEVFAQLQELASASGPGSQEAKINLLAALLSRCSQLEAKYIVRVVLATLRLGVAEMTVLSALSTALTGTAENKPSLEYAFNVYADLGEVAYRAVKQGVKALADATPAVGVPIRMMLAQRVRNLEEVLQHIPELILVEYKYDGERVQAHIAKKGNITLYSRRQENITHQFPEVVDALRQAVRGHEVVAEGEVVAIEKPGGKLQPFQVLMTRRRKHGVEEYVKTVPVKCFLFDVLYLDGKSLLKTPLRKRKDVLEKYFREHEEIVHAKYLATQDVAELESFFAEALHWGAEGVVMKDAHSGYEPGARGWRWIKFKREYQTELADTFDLVVVGGMYGAGRRAGTYGSLLGAAFDQQANKFYSLTKVGAGFTDKALAQLPTMLEPYRLPHKHRLVETGMTADVWFEPVCVMEVRGAELTVSPVHTTAREVLKKGGLALRFPRFVRWRDDKSPEQATTVQETYELYKSAKNKG